MADNTIRNALAIARNRYNAQKSFNPRAFDMAVLAFEEEMSRSGFEVRGIDFNRTDESALVWGRWEDEEYEGHDNDAYKLYETINRYNTRYVALDSKPRTRRG